MRLLYHDSQFVQLFGSIIQVYHFRGSWALTVSPFTIAYYRLEKAAFFWVGFVWAGKNHGISWRRER